MAFILVFSRKKANWISKKNSGEFSSRLVLLFSEISSNEQLLRLVRGLRRHAVEAGEIAAAPAPLLYLMRRQSLSCLGGLRDCSTADVLLLFKDK